MGHIPYGYRIVNGQADIDEAAAITIRALYKNYLTGMSLDEAASNAGIETYHGTVKRMLQNRHYVGDSFYPAIVAKETFDAVARELEKRAAALGRLNRKRPTSSKAIPTGFIMRPPEMELPNPFQQAEYLYSLIDLEVNDYGTR